MVRVAAFPVFLAFAAIASGCSAPVTSAPTPIPPAQTCAELSDVGTLVRNLTVAETDGRLVGQEHKGAMRLAARMLGRVTVEPNTELAGVVSALQKAAPADSTGVDPAATEWVETWALVQDACNDAMGVSDPLSGFGIEGWVGG